MFYDIQLHSCDKIWGLTNLPTSVEIVKPLQVELII